MKSLSAKVLGQIALIQSMVSVLPDNKKMLEFVCRGLTDVPSVVKADYCIYKGDIDEKKSSDKNSKSQHKFVIKLKDHQHGELLLKISDDNSFSPYIPFIENLTNMLAAIIEERHQRNLNESFLMTLENRVEERTYELSKVNEALKTDIRMRMQAENNLKKSEERFHTVADISFDVIWEWDIVGGVHTWFGDIDTQLGYEKNEFPRTIDAWEGILHPDDRDRVMENLTKHHEEHIPWHEEYRIFRKNGEIRYWDDCGETRWDKDGTPLVMTGAIIDITERKQAEESLRESEERFNFAMQGATDGLWDWDLKTNEVYYSPRWKSMLGYREDEITNHVSEGKRLLHPDDLDITFAHVESYINNEKKKYEIEFRMQHKDGHYVDILSRAFAVKDEEGVISRLVGTHIDITDRKRADEQISFQASHDSLTGLVNRYEFERRAERMLSTILEDENEHALCYMDLDQFKVVNDTCGHAAGDEMLRQLGLLLQDTVRNRDTLARLGGDEFGVLMEHCSLDDANRVAISLQKAIQDYQFSWEEYSFRVGVSIGLVPITVSTTSHTELMKEADAACYMAKEKGRNRIHVYRSDDTEIAQRHGEMQWVTRLNQALNEDNFCLYAQLIEPLDGSEEKHYELLIRMTDETGNIIPPGAFLPAAERYNLISQVDRWVITKAFDLLEDNPEFLKQIDACSINLSGQSLADMDFQQFVIDTFMDSDISPEKICFEITETAAITNLSAAKLFITKMKVLGCRFALDDFGSGLSSFGYLKNLEVDYLKIDGMFVRGIVDDPIDHAMVKSINEIGQVMGMKTIAEFVENEMIKGMLKEIGVNYAQGYGIEKPMPFDKLLGSPNNEININTPKNIEAES